MYIFLLITFPNAENGLVSLTKGSYGSAVSDETLTVLCTDVDLFPYLFDVWLLKRTYLT